MHRDLVEQRRWVSEEDYQLSLALAQIMPGPLAAHMAIALGYFRAAGVAAGRGAVWLVLVRQPSGEGSPMTRPLDSANPVAPAGAGTPEPRASSLSTVAIVVLAIGALYFGQDILVPFALAILLSFALGPLVTRLRRVGLPRVPAVLLVVTLAFAGIGAFGLVVGGQLAQLASNLPTYQQNIAAKIRSAQAAAPGGGVIDRAASVLRELREEFEQGKAPAAGPEAPVVRLEDPETSPLDVFRNVAGPLLGPIGTAGLVIVFVVFMLLEREDLRNRLIRLVGGDLSLTTEAMDEAARRVSRYLVMQLLVNLTYGVPIGVGLYLIGVPNALLWGVLATVLRFVPYIGPFIAALFPIALSIAVDPGWGMLFSTIGLFLVVELVSNNVVEPWLYGSSTGLSAVAIIVAAIFWTTLWGPVGLFLSTPLTVCLAVMGRYVPHLRFLDVMLGSEPALSPAEAFYQRMLAGDPDEGLQIAHQFLKERPLAAFYDEVALPALRLAERDRQRRALAPERRAAITASVLTVVADLADHEEPADDGGERTSQPVGDPAPTGWSGESVLCVAGRSGLDMAAGAMLAQLLERRGIGTRVLPADAVSPEGVGGLDLGGVQLVCLSYLGGAAVAQARQAGRRLRRLAPETAILVGFWNNQVDEVKAENPASALGADLVATSLAQAVDQIAIRATASAEAPPMPAPIPANEAERLEEIQRLGLLDTPPEPRFDRITRRLAKAFGVSTSLITLVDEHRQFWKSQTGLPEELAARRESPRGTSVCGHVVAADEVLVVEDVLKDKRFANNPFLREHGIRFYAGAPLRTEAGLAIGALCVIDTSPHTIGAPERALLQMLADEVMQEIRRSAGQPAEQGADTVTASGPPADSQASPA
jgi:predicted PurR-regulated permease PerM